MVFIKEWHAESPKKVLEAFNSTDVGLTSKQAEARLSKFGLNDLGHTVSVSRLKILMNQFKSFISIILIIAVIFSFVFGQQKQGLFIDPIIILFVLVLKIVVGFLYELRYYGFFEKIIGNSLNTATVKRDGRKVHLNPGKLVPGDYIYVKEGDIIPADARIIESSGLQTDESIIEGGEDKSLKSSATVSKKTKPQNMKNMLFTGSTVIKGSGKAVVVKTGKDIIQSGKGIKKDNLFKLETHLQKRARHLIEVLMILILLFCSIVFIVLIAFKDNFIYSIMYLLSLVVAVLPEGALAVSLISIAFGAGHLMDKNVLVRRPDTLENLACSDVICTDKTGTLTLGEMTVRKVYANREMIDVSGHGYEPFGNFTDSGNRKKNIRGIFQLFCCSILCNNSILKKDETGWFVEGDPTEGALLVLAKKGGIEKEQLELEMPRIKENPFDAEKKLMSTVHGFGKKELVFVKGAPEDLLERCSRININGSIIKLSYKEKNKVMENNASMGKKGLRVLGFAYKKRGKKEDEENLIFLGLVGMLDPPRRELISSIEKCKEAGICVKMITKDSRETAIAVAKELGIGDHAITGEELESMEGGVNDAVEAFNVYARVFPAQKIELARVLKKTGRTVAMLGDNVGETNALEFSDVGIAKGKNGTDASRKASDVIISDDSFDSIVNAIEGGRGTYDNIKKSATYIFACITGISLTVLIGMFIALFFSKDFPLLIFEPVHMILLFIFFGIVLYPGLCSQRPFSYVMQEKPRKKSESLIEKSNIFDIALAGIAICVGTLFAFKIGLESSVYHASTMAFATLVCFFVFCLLNFRNLKQSIFSEFFKGTKVFFLVVASLALLSVLIYFPGFSQNLFFIPLEFADWMIALSVSFSVFVLMEIKKFILKIFVKEVPFQRKAAAE